MAQRSFFYQIQWFIKNKISYILDSIIKRDNNIFLSGCKFDEINRETFNYNTKYFFLYISQNHPEIKFFWLCDDKDMLKEFHKRGYKNVVSRNSFKGIWAILKSKFWFCDLGCSQVTILCNKKLKSYMINFWHGSGKIKKYHYDNPDFKPNPLAENLKKWYDYTTINGEYERDARRSAFRFTDEKIITIGSPRNDVLYHDIKDSEMFMEKDFNNIKKLKENGKYLIFYAPTFRDTGKDISGWLKSEKLVKILKDNNAVLVCKLHPRDVNSLNFELPEEIYNVESSADSHPLLKYTDMLIADYSSIYFDYLLLDKPILYYVPDLEEYQEQCREFYVPFEQQSPGEHAKTENELFEILPRIINGEDNYKDARKELRDKNYKYQDGKNCERIFEFVKGISNNSK